MFPIRFIKTLKTNLQAVDIAVTVQAFLTLCDDFLSIGMRNTLRIHSPVGATGKLKHLLQLSADAETD